MVFNVLIGLSLKIRISVKIRRETAHLSPTESTWSERKSTPSYGDGPFN